MISREKSKVSGGTLIGLALGLAVILLGVEKFKILERKEFREIGHQASARMQEALAEIKRVKIERGIPLEKGDINSTGIIGPEFSPLVTSTGLLTAKRTATNPNFAGLITQMFLRAGVRKGDVVAFGLSGSFPSLNIASLSAAGTLGLRPIIISSVGSSNWGATHPEMTWLDMETILYAKGLIPAKSIAASPTGGGEQNFILPEGVGLAKSAVARNQVPLLQENNLTRHIRQRMDLYEYFARGRPIKTFVNVGGPAVNLGGEERRKEIPNGLILRPFTAQRGEMEGILLIMLRRGIPVIHLLNVTRLAQRNGLPRDPAPLPSVS